MEVLVINNYKTITDVKLNWRNLLGINGTKVAEVEAGRIMRNKELRNLAIVTIGVMLWVASNPTSVFAATGAAGIAALGNKFWGYVKVFARGACLVMAGIDTIKNLGSSDAKGIAKVVFKYVIAYAVVVLLPWIFDQVDATVSS